MTFEQTEDNPVEKHDKTNPAHYPWYPVEPIDIIRHQLGEAGFHAFCCGQAMRYRLRAGKKPGESEKDDLSKARWYERMALHVGTQGKVSDPRELREGWTKPSHVEIVTAAEEYVAAENEATTKELWEGV